MSGARCRLIVAVTLMTLIATAASTADEQKEGTLDDLRVLMAGDTLATGAFGELPLSLHAAELARANHHSRSSALIELQPETRYTLAVLHRATGPSIVTAGVKWLIPGQPAGLVDVEDHRVRWPASDEWVLRALTFTSDHEHTTARIILKAFGGMTLDVAAVALVEGWYAD